MHTMAQDILDYWFGSPDSEEYGKLRMWWFEKSDARDESIRNKFLALHQEVMVGHHRDMLNTPHGYMALIILLDQCSRNMFRNSPKAFASDKIALDLAKEAVRLGYDHKLPSFMRSFMYLPYEHSESLEDQEESVRLFEELGNAQGLDYALQHKAIIEKFGRYPHRNEILGRESTPEEIEFLKTPGSSF